MTESKAKPNYPAYIVLAASFVPFVFLELDPEITLQNSFYNTLLDNFGFLMLFQGILFSFVLAKSIKEYDLIHGINRVVMMALNTLFGFLIVTFFIAYLGYFNAGLNTFIWLNA